MQLVRSAVSVLAFVACCTYGSVASANARYVGHNFNPPSHSQQASANRFFGQSHWWNNFRGWGGWRNHGGWGWGHHGGHHGPSGGHHGGGGGHHNGGGPDCNVPEIPTSGLPSMAAVALGGVAIVLSRKARRLSE